MGGNKCKHLKLSYLTLCNHVNIHDRLCIRQLQLPAVGFQGNVGCIDSVLPPATGSRFWSTVKQQIQSWSRVKLIFGSSVKLDMSIVHACAQLHAVKCLGAGFMGVAKFKQISRGGVNGRDQNLVKSQGQILA